MAPKRSPAVVTPGLRKNVHADGLNASEHNDKPSGLQALVLAELRIAWLQARIRQNEIEATATAIKAGIVSPEQGAVLSHPLLEDSTFQRQFVAEVEAEHKRLTQQRAPPKWRRAA